MTTTQKVLIVDSDEHARERIKQLLAETSYTVVAEAETGAEAVRLILEQQPDIVLTEIVSLGDMSGLEIARSIGKMDSPPAIIFTTAYSGYALAAFSTKATGYLMKPIRQEQLLQSLEQARSLNHAQHKEALENRDGENHARRHICARVRGNLTLIPIEDVVYFQADQKYVTVRHRKGEVIIEESLKSLETDLADRFIRIHRNALVAKTAIAGLSKSSVGRTQIVLDNVKDQLEVSRRHLAEVRRLVRGRK